MLQDFIASIEQQGLRVRGIEVYQRGQKVAEHRWEADLRYSVHSVSKSFTSAAVGIAVGEGLLDVTERVVDIFPECVPEQDMPYLDELTVWHLLTMTTGHTENAVFDPESGIQEDDGVRHFLQVPLSKRPGSYYYYDNCATYVLSSIVTKRTGLSVRDYLMPRFFTPLGIENPAWQICPKGRNLGFTGLYLKTSEIAKLGLVYLNGGVWKDQQLVPADWVAESGKALVDSTPHKDGPDNAMGYGYQFWRCVPDAYRADGYLGQFAIVLNALDAVIAVSSWEPKAQKILDTLWATVLPKLQ